MPRSPEEKKAASKLAQQRYREKLKNDPEAAARRKASLAKANKKYEQNSDPIKRRAAIAAKQKRYRERVKNDPLRHAHENEMQRQRKREWRKNKK